MTPGAVTLAPALLVNEAGRELEVRKVDSRAPRAALDAAETTPIVYRDGDTIMHAGQTLQMQGGRWVALVNDDTAAASAALDDGLAKLTTALGAVNAGIAFADADRIMTALVESARALDVPLWLRDTIAQVKKVPADGRGSAWTCAIVGLAIMILAPLAAKPEPPKQ